MQRAAGLFLAPALAACLAVASCTSSAEPPPIDDLTPSALPSPSSSPSATPPTLPPEAEGTSPAAAKAFVRHYVSTVNFATTTGKVESLRALGDAKCDSCSAVIDRIRGVYAAGGSIESDGWVVTNAGLLPNQPEDRPILNVGIRLSPQQVVSAKDADPKRFDGGRLPTTFYLGWTTAGWVVTKWDRSA